MFKWLTYKNKTPLEFYNITGYNKRDKQHYLCRASNSDAMYFDDNAKELDIMNFSNRDMAQAWLDNEDNQEILHAQDIVETRIEWIRVDVKGVLV